MLSDGNQIKPNLGKPQMSRNMPPVGPQMTYGMPPGGGHMSNGMPPVGPQMGHSMPPAGGQMSHGMPPAGAPMSHGMPPVGPQMGHSMPPAGGQMSHGMPPAGGQMSNAMPPAGGPMSHSMPPAGPLMGGHSMPPAGQQMSHSGSMPPPDVGQPYGPQSGGPMAQSAIQQQKRFDPNMMPGAMQAHNGMPPFGNEMPSDGNQMKPNLGPPQMTHNMPPVGPQMTYGMPPVGSHMSNGMPPAGAPMSHGMPPVGPQMGHNMPPAGGQMSHGMPPVGPQMSHAMPPAGGMSHGMPPVGPQMTHGMPPVGPPMGGHGMPPVGPQMTHGGPMPPPGVGQPYGPQSGPMAQSAAQQQKRLDPNMMPSAVQVMEDDRRARSGAFPTGFPRAELPPLVTSDFFSEDQGNCLPKFMRSTLYAGPANNDLLKQSAVPLALCICPVAKLGPQERQLPIVNLGELGPVRCTRCKAYMCPFMEFKDGGRRFRCPFCKSSTEVPTEYFAHLDQNGQRTDIYERPELCLGSYEFVATKEYCKNNLFPKSPAFIFMLDVSYNAIRNGMVKLFCDNIKSLIQNLPKEFGNDRSAIDVGFATYDQSVHFYNLKSALGQPKMLIVNDVQDTFVPLVDGFLVNLQEAEAVIDTLLAQIPQMFAETKVTEIVLGPAIQAGLDALKSSDRPGKLFIFHTSLPTYDAPGKLKNRDDRAVLGTEKEKTVILPQSEFYNKLAQDCVGAGCCVDVYLFPNSYADVATIGCLCGMTGGQLYKYQYFQADIDGERFLADLKHDIERPIVFDAIMRIRTSTGIRPTDFYGNFYMSNTTDVELAALDCDKTVTVEIKHDDKIEDAAVCFQVALLFTSVGGQRRLRIHNLSLAVGTDLASLYRSADLFTVVNYLAKQGERLLLQKAPRDVRENMVNRCAQMLATYRQHCSPGSSLGQLVLPETMKLLPLLVNCIIKHSAFTGGSDLSIDDKAWLMQILPSMSPLDTVYYFYPRILPVYEFLEDSEEFPTPVRCSYENLCSTGAYLFENGIVILFWIGLGVSQQWVQDVFGVQNFAQINAEKHDLPEKDNGTSRNLRRLLNKLQSERTRTMKLYIIKQQDKLEPWFRKFMVEDKGSDSSPSYVEFLCHVHKEIRNLLS